MQRYTTQQVIKFDGSRAAVNILRSGSLLVEQWDGVNWIEVETLSKGADMYSTGSNSFRFTPSAGVTYTISK